MKTFSIQFLILFLFNPSCSEFHIIFRIIASCFHFFHQVPSKQSDDASCVVFQPPNRVLSSANGKLLVLFLFLFLFFSFWRHFAFPLFFCPSQPFPNWQVFVNFLKFINFLKCHNQNIIYFLYSLQSCCCCYSPCLSYIIIFLEIVNSSF